MTSDKGQLANADYVVSSYLLSTGLVVSLFLFHWLKDERVHDKRLGL